MSKTESDKPRKLTAPAIRDRKGKAPIVSVVAYTYPIAKILDPIVDFILVGDSVGITVYGQSTTIGVTLDMMIAHGKAVVNATTIPCVMVDMPFGSYEKSPQQAFENAARIMAETGCDAVKLEGGQNMAETIAFLTARGIPVCGHIGLQPQQMNTTGGFKTQGKNDAAARRIMADAKAVEQAGAFAIVVEAVPEALGTEITQQVSVPTIGIGASRECDGQILLIDDLIGLFDDFTARFVKKYAQIADTVKEAVQTYASETRAGTFPGPDNVY